MKKSKTMLAKDLPVDVQAMATFTTWSSGYTFHENIFTIITNPVISTTRQHNILVVGDSPGYIIENIKDKIFGNKNVIEYTFKREVFGMRPKSEQVRLFLPEDRVNFVVTKYL
jgi:hypothetical protein